MKHKLKEFNEFLIQYLIKREYHSSLDAIYYIVDHKFCIKSKQSVFQATV